MKTESRLLLRKRKRWVVQAQRVGAWVFGRPQDKVVLVRVFALAWPIAVALLGETAIGLVDTKLVGGLGGFALGGVGIALMIMYLGYSLISGAMRGVKIQVAYALGEGRREEARDYAVSGVCMAFVGGLVLFALGRDITLLLRLLRVREELVEPARDFYAAITWGAPAAGVQYALIQYRQGLSDARTPTAVQVSGNILNGLLAYALVYGHFGLPAYGVRGAGYATAITLWVNAAVLSALFLRKPTAWSRLRGAARAVLRVGLPTGLQFFAELLAMVTFTILLGGIAPAEIAGHQIALMIMRASFLPGVALGEAASVMVGQSLGAGNPRIAYQATRSALRMAIAFMFVCGVGFAVFGASLAAFFTPDPRVREVTTRLLLLAALFQLPDAVNIVLRGALRGAKDTVVPARIGILVIWLCVPTAAFVLGRLAGLGAAGGWCGFLLETTIAGLLLARRYRQTQWSEAIPLRTGAKAAATPTGLAGKSAAA